MKPFTVDTIRIHLPMFDAAKVRGQRQRQEERARARVAPALQPIAPAPKPAPTPKVVKATAAVSGTAGSALVAKTKAQEQRSELTQLLFPNGL